MVVLHVSDVDGCDESFVKTMFDKRSILSVSRDFSFDFEKERGNPPRRKIKTFVFEVRDGYLFDRVCIKELYVKESFDDIVKQLIEN